MGVDDEFVPFDSLTAEALLAKQPEQDERLSALFAELARAFRNGELSYELPDSDLAAKLSSNPYLVCKDNKIYFERSWHILERIDKHLKELEAAPLELPIDSQGIASSLDALPLLPEQKAAISNSLQQSISCIWGGPGTGKTFTAGWLVQLFTALFPEAKIALTASTGKASANLACSIQRACQARFETKTLHALLGIRRQAGTSRYRASTLPYDLLLVDESSMIDAALFLKLLEEIKLGSRVVFLGDPNQLSPVEPGEPFSLLVKRRTEGELVTTKRQEEGAILDLARHVLAGSADAALACLTTSTSLEFVSIDDEEAVVKRLYTHRPLPESVDIASGFKALQKRRILSPLRTGKFGISQINELVKTPTFTPILVTQNDYHLNLTNGQVGIVQGQHAYFEDFENPGTILQIPTILLPAFEPAFCLSVHKSQGSEFDDVLLILPDGATRFGRRLLYTAITRARKRFTLISSEQTFRACLESASR